MLTILRNIAIAALGVFKLVFRQVPTENGAQKQIIQQCCSGPKPKELQKQISAYILH
jgi:hypothetical protein